MVNEPTEATQTTLSRLLSELRHGSRYALWPLVYYVLRILAHRRGIVHLRGGLVPRYWIPAGRRWPGHRWRSHRLTLTRRAR